MRVRSGSITYSTLQAPGMGDITTAAPGDGGHHHCSPQGWGTSPLQPPGMGDITTAAPQGWGTSHTAHTTAPRGWGTSHTAHTTAPRGWGTSHTAHITAPPGVGTSHTTHTRDGGHHIQPHTIGTTHHTLILPKSDSHSQCQKSGFHRRSPSYSRKPHSR